MNTQNSALDLKAMKMALALARRGSGFTRPNPIVGAVLVRDGKVVGKGWHRAYGSAHAEVEAIGAAGGSAAGADLYVTLEPCNHHGRTGPCTEAIIAAGIKRVFMAMPDPNPGVRGGGGQRLQEAGIEIFEGLCGPEARLQNALWINWIKIGRPLLVLKLAVSSNGKLAQPANAPRWISSAVARAQVQRLRRHFDAILVGSKTVAADNPGLTNRSGLGPQPLRVIIDSHLSTAVDSAVCEVDATKGLKTMFAALDTCSQEKRSIFTDKGGSVRTYPRGGSGVDLSAVLKDLGESGIQGVLCEGGARIASEVLQQGLCAAVILYHSEAGIEDAKMELPQFDSTANKILARDFRLFSEVPIGKHERREVFISKQLGDLIL